MCPFLKQKRIVLEYGFWGIIHSIRVGTSIGLFIFLGSGFEMMKGWWVMFKVWPRMFYRSGWLRCVVRICVGCCVLGCVFVLGWSWWKVVDCLTLGVILYITIIHIYYIIIYYYYYIIIHIHILYIIFLYLSFPVLFSSIKGIHSSPTYTLPFSFQYSPPSLIVYPLFLHQPPLLLLFPHPNLLFNPSSIIQIQPIPILPSHQPFYTCRWLVILIYIPITSFSIFQDKPLRELTWIVLSFSAILVFMSRWR